MGWTVAHVVFSVDVSGMLECLRALPAALCASAGRGCLCALCELRRYGLTSLQHPCHQLYKSLLSDLCQGDKWSGFLERAFFFFGRGR